MIQFNLLPSVKREYVRAKRNKRLIILVSSLVGAVSILLFVLLFFSIQYVQKRYSESLSADIKTESKKLQGIADLNKVLTIQNQVNSLTGLHDKKPATPLLYGYLKQFTPEKASIASVAIDFDTQTITMNGEADSISIVNTFVDTLKFTDFKTADNKTSRAFSSVVLEGFGRSDKNATYQISLKYDPAIFVDSGKPVLVVPEGKVTTRSQTNDLFKPLTNPDPKK